MFDVGVQAVNNETVVAISLSPFGWTTCGRNIQNTVAMTNKTHFIVEKGVHSIYVAAFQGAFNTKLVCMENSR